MDDEQVRLELATISKRIKVGLVERDMTQAELADAIPIAHPTLSHYMTGKRAIPMPTLIRIAEIFGVKPSNLLPDT